MLVATSIASLVAIFMAVFFIHGATGAHADASTTDPSVLTDDSALNNGHAHTTTVTPRGHTNGQGHARFGIDNIDSIQNFNEHYFQAGFDSNGNPTNEWFTNTVGNPAQMGGTTSINAPIIPVKVVLLDAAGNPKYTYDPMQYVQQVLDSPIFQNSSYSSSSTPTQFNDAVQRAEYFGKAKADWHTMLVASVKTERTMTVPAGFYKVRLNGDGSVRYMLIDADKFGSLLFPSATVDMSTPVGAAEITGEITTKDISTFLFPNTFLYVGTTANCCILGYHTFDYELGDASNGNLPREYVLNYSSWVTPGIFRGGVDAPQDVTTISHETSEIFNDPFVAADGIHNITPWWASSFNCQNNLETGDVVEGLPGDNHTITMNGFTYHVQNVAIHQWFTGETPSSAVNGQYSYPDPVLTSAAVSQPYNCGQ